MGKINFLGDHCISAPLLFLPLHICQPCQEDNNNNKKIILYEFKEKTEYCNAVCFPHKTAIFHNVTQNSINNKKSQLIISKIKYKNSLSLKLVSIQSTGERKSKLGGKRGKFVLLLSTISKNGLYPNLDHKLPVNHATFFLVLHILLEPYIYLQYCTFYFTFIIVPK